MTRTAGLCPEDQLAAATSVAHRDAEAGYAEADRLSMAYPDDPRLHFLLGSLAAGLLRYAEARRSMERAVALAPGFSLARFQCGLLLLTSAEAESAEAMLVPLLALGEDDPFGALAAGLLHLVRDEFTLAINAIERGIRLNLANAPLNRDMRMLIGEIEAKIETGDAAIDIPQSAAHALLQQSALKATRH